MKRFAAVDLLVKKHGYEHIVELGVWKGATLQYVLSRNPDLHYTGIDRYEADEDGVEETYVEGENGHEWDHEEYWMDNVEFTRKYPNAQILRMTTVEGADFFENESLDLVFIDAAHDYASVKADITHWLPKIRKGGVIMGHDYSPEFQGVVDAVDELIDNPTVLGDTVWMKMV